jgi:hypothetical protein
MAANGQWLMVNGRQWSMVNDEQQAEIVRADDLASYSH